jgi:hypothetical protein
MSRAEYRVVWRRQGLTQRRRIFQTLAGAQNHARVVSVPPDEIDDEEIRRSPGLADMPWLVYGPVIETREVGEWGPC